MRAFRRRPKHPDLWRNLVGASLGSAAVLAAVAGAAAGAGAMVARNLGLSHKAEQMEVPKKSGEKTEV